MSLIQRIVTFGNVNCVAFTINDAFYRALSALRQKSWHNFYMFINTRRFVWRFQLIIRALYRFIDTIDVSIKLIRMYRDFAIYAIRS